MKVVQYTSLFYKNKTFLISSYSYVIARVEVANKI